MLMAKSRYGNVKSKLYITYDAFDVHNVTLDADYTATAVENDDYFDYDYDDVHYVFWYTSAIGVNDKYETTQSVMKTGS